MESCNLVHEFEFEVGVVGVVDEEEEVEEEEEEDVPKKLSIASLSMLIRFPKVGGLIIRGTERRSGGCIKIELLVFYDSPIKNWIYIKRERKRKGSKRRKKKKLKNIDKHGFPKTTVQLICFPCGNCIKCFFRYHVLILHENVT